LRPAPTHLNITRHTLFNLVGLGAPLLLALVAIPPLLEGLGASRFGVLTLIWAVTSYFGLFDLGLGRALTQALAQALGNRDDERIGQLSATALAMMAALGCLGGLLMALLAPWGAQLLKDVPDRDAALRAVWAMAAALPFIVLTAGLRGMLEATHAFAALNLVRLPMGLWTFAGPWLVLNAVGPDLFAISLALAAGRLLGCIVHAGQVWQALPQLHGRMHVKRSLLRPLSVAGGWLTLSNVLSSFMGYVDRFVIGAVLSAVAVAHYATPQELVTKLWIVPGALTAVLLPTFAAGQRDAAAWRLFDRALVVLVIVLLPVCAALTAFAEPLLSWWLSPDFSAHSAPVLQVFAMGIFINCLAHVPLTWLHGAGHFRAPALLQSIQLPLFLPALWWMTAKFGLMGAAWTWFGRMTIDALALFALALRERA
jgi:O-antigen/teichoic acid export membrane protein